jgi:hypothetical protein
MTNQPARSEELQADADSESVFCAFISRHVANNASNGTYENSLGSHVTLVQRLTVRIRAMMRIYLFLVHADTLTHLQAHLSIL